MRTQGVMHLPHLRELNVAPFLQLKNGCGWSLGWIEDL